MRPILRAYRIAQSAKGIGSHEAPSHPVLRNVVLCVRACPSHVTVLRMFGISDRPVCPSL